MKQPRQEVVRRVSGATPLRRAAQALLALSLLLGVTAVPQLPWLSGAGAGEALAAGVNWGDLSPAQQALLKSKQSEWANLSTGQQETLARGAERWLAMTPDEKRLARERLEQYKQMTPAQRQEVLAKREQFRALAPERQRKLHERHEQFKKLPPEQQKEIREAYGQSRRQSLEQNRQLRECLKRKADGESVDCSRYTAPDNSPRKSDKDRDAPGVRLPKL